MTAPIPPAPLGRHSRSGWPCWALACLLAAGGGCGPAGQAARAGGAGDAGVEIARLDPPAARGSMAPFLAIDGEELLLSWLEPVAGGGHRLRLARLAGETWGRPVTIVEGERLVANWADTPSVAADGAGTLLAHWLEKRGSGTYAYGVRLARSTDGGGRWHDLGLLHRDDSPTEHGFVSLAPLPRGGFEATWLDGREMPGGGPMGLRWASVAAGGAVAEGERLIDGRVCDCCQTAAVATPAGTLVAYRDRGGDERRDVAVLRHTDAGWTSPRAVHDDGWVIPGCPVNGPALAAAAGRTVLAWFTAAADRPRVLAAVSRDGGATFSAPVELDAEAPLGRVGAAFAGDGGAVVSWLARDGTVRLRRIEADGTAGALTVVGAAGTSRASGFPRLAPAGSGVAVAWVETSGELPRRLRLALVAPR